MRIRLLLVTACAALAGTLVAPATARAAETVPTPLIIGGGTTSSAPWSAQIYVNGSFNCSGTIIAARWVLTARHCTGSGLTVRVGNVNLGSGTTANVSTYHSRYDLALLHLDRAISTSYVTLASSDPATGTTNSIYGWGRTCYSGCDAAPVLKTATVRVTGFTTDAYGGRAIRSTRINGNAWKGDSGGPEFYNGAQVGVASTADGRSIQNYASVANSRTWIRTTSGV